MGAALAGIALTSAKPEQRKQAELLLDPTLDGLKTRSHTSQNVIERHRSEPSWLDFPFGKLHPSGVEAAAGGLDVTEVLVGPAAHSVDRRPKALARPGEGVFDPRRHGGVHAALDQTVALQHAQILGEHLVADALDLVPQLAEAQGASTEGLDDQERPLVGDIQAVWPSPW